VKGIFPKKNKCKIGWIKQLKNKYEIIICPDGHKTLKYLNAQETYIT
jgi:hypothetical protein